MGLELAIQELHQQGKQVEISWLWDGGVDVNAGGEEKNFRTVADVTPWLRHWYGLGATPDRDQLATEFQKVYDSEIHVTLRTGGKQILVALETDFTGLEEAGYIISASEILPRLQSVIHKYAPMSKYDVERLGGTFIPEMAEIPNK
jgi:hypothetical protein